MQAAQDEADAQKAALLNMARARAVQLRVDAEGEIAHERAVQARAVEDDAVRLAIEIAGRVLDRLPPQARVEGFIDGAAEALAAMPPEARAGFGAGGEPLALAAPRELSDTERQACEIAFGVVLGRPVTLQVRADPTLIAGLELTGAHAAVCNHLRHDLDAIRATLLEHGGELR